MKLGRLTINFNPSNLPTVQRLSGNEGPDWRYVAVHFGVKWTDPAFDIELDLGRPSYAIWREAGKWRAASGRSTYFTSSIRRALVWLWRSYKVQTTVRR